MKDANGILDLNYDGNFNQTSAVASARANLHLGWQREFGKKLRLGATLNLTQILAHAELQFDSLGLRSTDMGNVSYLVPGIHPMIKVAPFGTAIHTEDFARYAAETEADQAIVDGAKAMALTVVDCWADPSVLDAARAEFAAVHG